MAEEIRDSALAASGLLTRTIGGPSVKPYQPAGLWEQSGTGKTYTQDTARSCIAAACTRSGAAPRRRRRCSPSMRCRVRSARPSGK